MTRKFKMVGVLMAVVAMFAVTASSASATFTSAGYPATAHAEDKTAGDVFDAFGSSIKCTETTFKVEKTGGGALEGPATDVTVKAHYTKCTAFGLPATVNMTSCDFVFHSHSPNPGNLIVDVECTKAGDEIDITVFSTSTHSTVLCHVGVPQQTGKTGLIATNNGNHIRVSGSVGGLTATQVRNSAFCPTGTHTNTATYTVDPEGITVIGSNGAVSVS